MNSPLKHPLAITLGDPAGIGADIVLSCYGKRTQTSPAFAVIGSAQVLRERAEMLGVDVAVEPVGGWNEVADAFVNALPVIDIAAGAPVTAGETSTDHAEAVIASIKRGVEAVLRGEASGLVTNPIHKSTLYAAGFNYQGHTDFLAHLARQAGHVAEPVMMLVAKDLRTVPLSVHVPLRQVADLITRELIVAQTRVVAVGLQRWFGIETPRIAVTGLNPHAGETATIGIEERDTIAPAIAELQAEGIDVRGPLSADTLFHEEARAEFDAVVCMYHDQALIPVKTIGFHDGVNTTLGLPFIRTSPDHGTALTLAGTGKARPDSLAAAIALAAHMAAGR